MRTMKNFAAAALVMLLCTVVFGVFFTSCENSIEGDPSFTASVKKIRVEVPIEVRDTIWQKEYITIRDTITMRDTVIIKDVDSIYVEVIKKEGIKANGQAGLEKIDDKGYLTWYPLIEDGNPVEPSTELNVRASIEDCDHDIIVVSNPVIGAPKFSAQKSTRQYQDGDFTKLEFKATWVYNFGSFTEKVNTVHEAAWYKGWQMLSSYWTGGLKSVEYGEGQPYTYNGIEGTLYENTLTWEFTYNENDIRTFTKTHKFFVANEIVEPDPEATEMFGKDFSFKTTSDNTAETSFVMWQKLNNGKEEKLAEMSATLRFWLVNAEGVVVDLNSDEAFALTDGQAVAGRKEKVGEPRLVGSISIQEYVTTYTTKTDKSESVFYGHTEEATYVVPQGMGENIQFLSKDFAFRDNGTTQLTDMAGYGYEQKHAFTRIVATYHDRSLNGEGEIILRRQKGEEPKPEKALTSVEEKSFDRENTYVITRHYSDGSVSDTTVINTYGYTHKIVMPTLNRLYRDNTNFGNPTISKNGSASKVGNSSTKEGLTFQTMKQEMNAAYNDHSHIIELQYTDLTYTEKGKSCKLSVPMWTLTYNAVNKGTVRTETENSHNYEVTPVSFVYNGAFSSNSAKYNTDTEVWKDLGEEASQKGTLGKNFGFDYVNPTTSYTYATFYAIMSDGTEKELGTDGVEIYNSIEAPAAQNINSEDFTVVDANAVEGSKQLVSTREAAGKYGKFIVKKYKTTYTTKTNKAEAVFVAYHEEAEFVPTIGDSFTLISKTYGFTDLGSSTLVDLGRKDGKDGKMYKSQISATFNDRSTDASAEVSLWVVAPNQFGISSGSQSHTWDYNNAHHIATIFVYNIYENGQLVGGGLKGFIDGKEVAKKSWDEVNAPSGVASLAQKADGTWVFTRAYQSGNAFIWRSIEKANNNTAITSIELNQVQIAAHGKPEVYIASSSKENADGSVTVSSAEGSATAAAW